VFQNAGIEMQSRSFVVDSVTDEGAAGVQQQISLVGASQVPSDASQAEKRMLLAIASSLQQGAPAVVDAMVAAWETENVTAKKSKKILDLVSYISSDLRELPLSAACAMNQSLAVISELLKVFPVDAQTEDARKALRYAARYNSDVAVVTELLKAFPDSVREKDEDEWLPLHRAAKFSTNFAVFAELLNAHPEEDPLEGFDPFALENPNFTEAAVCEYFSLHPDFAFNKRVSLKACGPAILQMDNLASFLLRCQHPLHSCLQLAGALKEYSLQNLSGGFGLWRQFRNIQLASDADEKAAEIEQLACAIVRKCNAEHFDQEMDHCIELAVDLKLKFFMGLQACNFRLLKRFTTAPAVFIWYAELWSFLFIMVFLVGNMPRADAPICTYMCNMTNTTTNSTESNRALCTMETPCILVSREIFAAFWLFDMCLREVFELYDTKKRHPHTRFSKFLVKYFTGDWWNVYDLVSFVTAILAAVARGCVLAGVGFTASSSNQLFAWAFALMWFRILYLLSFLFPFIGMLLHMVFRMLFGDVLQFAVVAFLMLTPFVQALSFLEHGISESVDEGNLAFANSTDGYSSFFQVMIGQGPPISSLSASSAVLLAVGSFLLTVLLLNLLIAMFSKTFDSIHENSKQDYLLIRAQIFFGYMYSTTFPSPFALISRIIATVISLIYQFLCLFSCIQPCLESIKTKLNSQFPKLQTFELFVLPKFDRKDFFVIAFAKDIPDGIADGDRESIKEWKARYKNDPQFIVECEARYELWCKEVLQDWEEKSEFNSDAQMDRFKSRMLRGMQNSVDAGNKMYQMQSQMAENAKTVNFELKALSEKIQSQQNQIQLLLQKLNA
jgi:hypothetical protein